MKKDFKVIEIRGLASLALFCMVLMSAVAVLVLFPTWMVMSGWNSILSSVFHVVRINYFQASLLWFACVLGILAFMKSRISIELCSEKKIRRNAKNSGIQR